MLVAIPGTPEAKEALIANQIPQTATISRTAAHLTVKYRRRARHSSYFDRDIAHLRAEYADAGYL